MYWHTMKTCALLLGLVVLAGAREGRPFPTHATSSSLKSDCEDMAEDSLGHQTESVSRVLTDALLQLENRITALTESMQLQEERMTTVFIAPAGREDGDRVAGGRAPGAAGWGRGRPPTRAGRAPAAHGRRSEDVGEAIDSLPREGRRRCGRRAGVLAAAGEEGSGPGGGLQQPPVALHCTGAPCHSPCLHLLNHPSLHRLIKLSSPLHLYKRAAALRPALPPTSAPSAHHQQTERMRVEERMEEAEAKKKRAQEQPSPLGEALVKAAQKGSLRRVQRFLDDGADVNYTYSRGRSPLKAAADSSAASSPEVVLLLLRRGADVNAINEYGDSALHCAAFKSNEPVVPLLIGVGAEVDARNQDGATPLHLAAFSDEEAAARALLGCGARKDFKGWKWVFRDKTPFDIARSDALRNLLRT